MPRKHDWLRQYEVMSLHDLSVLLFLLRSLPITHSQWTLLPNGTSPRSMYYFSEARTGAQYRFDRCPGEFDGAYLVHINTAEEHFGLAAVFPRDRSDDNNNKFYIGLQRERDGIRWFWVWHPTLTKHDTCYTNWNRNHPDIVKSKNDPVNYFPYYNFKNNRWDAHSSINRKYHYICEAPSTCYDYCFNNGRCILDTTSGQPHSCVCPPHVTGSRCEAVLPFCQSDSCLNGGTCLETPTRFQCMCGPYSTGERCELDINECNVPPGVPPVCPPANGRCVNRFHVKHECECNVGLTGDTCELEVSSCDDDPCLNGGVCITDPEAANGVSCSCTGGHRGTWCEHRASRCHPNPCRNGGTCVDGDRSFSCSCPFSHTGATCEADVDECSAYGYCATFNCRNTDGSYLCDCPAGYTGPDCNEDINECIIYPNSCYGRGVCINTVGSYTCRCTGNYDPQRFCAVPMGSCNTRVASESQASTSTSRVTATTVAGFVLIVAELVIVVALTYSLLTVTLLKPKLTLTDDVNQVGRLASKRFPV